MTREIVKPIMTGILAGVAIYALPVTLKILAVLLLLGIVIRLFAFLFYRPRHAWAGGNHGFYCSGWHHMTREERKRFFEKFRQEFDSEEPEKNPTPTI